MVGLRQAGSDSLGGGLASDVENEIRVALDRWSVGQVGLSDLLIALAVVLVGALLAWLTNRLARRIARGTDGAAQAAIATAGLLASTFVALLAAALALEILGFSLGPILVLVILVTMSLLLLRPIITNLSSGVLLQVRGVLELGDLVLADGQLGVVQEINARSVVLETSDGRRLYVPNTAVFSETIENYSALGRRRSSFDLMVSSSVDLGLFTATVRAALDEIEPILNDPAPEVQVVRLAGDLVVLTAYVWHEPAAAAQRAVIDEAARSVLAAIEAAGLRLEGPQWMQLDVAAPVSRGRSGSAGG